MKTLASEAHVKAFLTALMSDDNESIRMQFVRIVNSTHKRNYWLPTFFSNTRQTGQAIVNLIDVLSALEAKWFKKLNTALELNLTDEQLSSQEDVKTVLEQYITANPMLGGPGLKIVR